VSGRVGTTVVARGLGEGLLDTVTGGGTGSAVRNHLADRAVRARVDAGARSGTVVRLHETGVDDTVVGGGDADAALALLHDDGEDEAGVDAGLAGELVDGLADAVNLISRVVSAPAVPAARLLHQGEVGIPELVEGAPSRLVGPASTDGAVTLVADVSVGKGSGAASGSGAGEAGEGSKSENKSLRHFELVLFEKSLLERLKERLEESEKKISSREDEKGVT